MTALAALLPLGPDELLTSTRSVRRRLDVSRPVPGDVVEECIAIGLQAPTGANVVHSRFVVVRDPDLRRAVGDIYRRAYEIYRSLDGLYIGSIDKETDDERARQRRSAASADHLGEHMGDAPVLVLACLDGMRADGLPASMVVPWLGNILPAMWSFMLAARARGLGTAWTTNHLFLERELADLLDIPFETVQQVCLTPLAYTQGTEFRAAGRPPVDTVIGWDGWRGAR
jgi:nitroreductase